MGLKDHLPHNQTTFMFFLITISVTSLLIGNILIQYALKDISTPAGKFDEALQYAAYDGEEEDIPEEIIDPESMMIDLGADGCFDLINYETETGKPHNNPKTAVYYASQECLRNVRSPGGSCEEGCKRGTPFKETLSCQKNNDKTATCTCMSVKPCIPEEPQEPPMPATCSDAGGMCCDANELCDGGDLGDFNDCPGTCCSGTCIFEEPPMPPEANCEDIIPGTKLCENGCVDGQGFMAPDGSGWCCTSDCFEDEQIMPELQATCTDMGGVCCEAMEICEGNLIGSFDDCPDNCCSGTCILEEPPIIV